MWVSALLMLPLAMHIAAITVSPHDEATPTEVTRQYTRDSPRNDDTEVYQSGHEQPTTDSYRVQSDELPEPPAEAEQDGVPSPARYLLPPRQDADVFSYPSASQAGGDWTPMLQGLPKAGPEPPLIHKFSDPEESETLKDSYGSTITLTRENDLPRETFGQWFNPKLVESQGSAGSDVASVVIVPSGELQPPLTEIPVTFDASAPATELQPPLFRPNTVFRPNIKQKLSPIMPTISLEMQPPSPLPKRYKKPTILYPKKYTKLNEYRPIPIPMRYEGDIREVPKAKPMKYFKPQLNVEEDEADQEEDEKKILKFKQNEEKRKFKEEEDAKKQQEFVDATVAEVFAPQQEAPAPPAGEQDVSETGFYGDGREGYAAPPPAHAPLAEDAAAAPAPAERTEFRMHGLQGPHSYKFGYDTGKGKNRQFRYEERSNEGHVRGHYGYVDQRGKTHVVNYDAHPERGFHAEGPFGAV